MIRNVEYHTWRDVPLPIVVQELNRLCAGVAYFPQNFSDKVGSMVFRDIAGRDVLVPAIEGLELALMIADRLALDYSVYSNEQTTIRSIQASARRRLRQASP